MCWLSSSMGPKSAAHCRSTTARPSCVPMRDSSTRSSCQPHTHEAAQWLSDARMVRADARQQHGLLLPTTHTWGHPTTYWWKYGVCQCATVSRCLPAKPNIECAFTYTATSIPTHTQRRLTFGKTPNSCRSNDNNGKRAADPNDTVYSGGVRYPDKSVIDL
jgi:hypothetical protein